MRALTFAAALLALGCLPPIPRSTVAATLAQARATASVCRLTGEVLDRPQLLGVDQGSLALWQQCIGSVVVRRPDGLLVIDSGFGSSIREDMKKGGPLFEIALGGAHTKTPLVELMDKVQMDPFKVKWVALTHAHWDHTGGIRDLPRAQVLLSRAEQKAYWNLGGAFTKGAMPHHLAVPEGRFAPFDFDGPPVLGFPASHDLFGDGSVVAVPTPGHTPGSTSYLVRGDDGKNWLLIGDSAWSVEGVKRPAHKNALVSMLFDGDPRTLATTLGQLHAVSEQRPDVVVVPAHDFAAFGLIPECSAPRSP
jgi:N-acyl homoserine lactone hydrolase